MLWLVCILLTIGLGSGVAVHLKSRSMLRPITKRPCAGIRWRRAFPEASPDAIRSFVALFADAFLFPKKHRHRLRPSDRVMDVYRVFNPRGVLNSDVMELETLALELEQTYNLQLDGCWHDELTLGELFECTLVQPAAAVDGCCL